MRRSIAVRLALCLSLAGAQVLAASPTPMPVTAAQPTEPSLTDKLTPSERAWIASVIYRTVKEYFAHWSGLPADFNFDHNYRTYLNQALPAPDRRAFSLATMRLVASLQNGHTEFTDDALYQDKRILPFYAEPIQGRWTVTVSRTPEISPGDVISAIDGVSIEAWVAPIRAVIGQSSARARDHLVFLRRFMFPERFTVQLDDGRHVAVNRNAPLRPRRGRPRLDEVTVQKRPDGVVVIAIPSFDDPHFEADAIKAIQSSTGAPLILLDVRGNGGGTTPAALLKAIMTNPYEGTVAATPLIIAENDAHGSFTPDDNPAPNAFLRYGPEVSQPSPAAYPGAMALLIDRECGSACEDFAIRFQSGHRGPVLGEPTWGSTGQPIFVKFPEFGMSLRVSTKRETFADGRRFEGVGVQPDIAIPLSRADVVASGDPVLDRAITLAMTNGNKISDH